MMKTFLGDRPHFCEATEFLCLTNRDEVTHYEVLSAMAKGIKDNQFASTIHPTLEEEKKILTTVHSVS